MIKEGDTDMNDAQEGEPAWDDANEEEVGGSAQRTDPVHGRRKLMLMY